MSLSIDHVVILVNDLAAASADYTSLGFNVVPGGEHADGATHNALISFADGSYLELFAFRREAPNHRWWRYAALGEGLVDFALLPSDITRDVTAIGERGLAFQGPVQGGRIRPDGQQIGWQTAMAPSRDLPFLCADVTPRSLRVPEGEATEHPNGATGISYLTVAVADLEASAGRYRALLGLDPTVGPSPDPDVPRTVTFTLGPANLILAQPSSAGDPVAAYLQARGEGLYALALNSTAANFSLSKLNSTLTHAVWLELVAAPI